MSGLLGGTSSLAFPLPAAAPERVFIQTNPPLLQQEDPFTDTRWADSLCPKTCLSHTTWYQQSIVFAPSEEQNLPGKTTGAGPGTTQPPLSGLPGWAPGRGSATGTSRAQGSLCAPQSSFWPSWLLWSPQAAAGKWHTQHSSAAGHKAEHALKAR